MVVKDKKGRKRYILFTIGDVDKKEIQKALKGKYPQIRLILYDGKYGIVKCRHSDKDNVIGFYRSPSFSKKLIQQVKVATPEYTTPMVQLNSNTKSPFTYTKSIMVR